MTTSNTAAVEAGAAKKAQFTSGPWQATGLYIRDAERNVIAKMSDDDANERTIAADARLIAQAPAMFEVIESITWRGHAEGCDARRKSGAVFEEECNCLVRQARAILAAVEGSAR